MEILELQTSTQEIKSELKLFISLKLVGVMHVYHYFFYFFFEMLITGSEATD
jgi:hypothetical protein